jgi:hypothetical protein
VEEFIIILIPRLSTGIIGGTTKLGYDHSSFMNFGFGGFHSQYHFTQSKVRITGGLLLGYGSTTNYHITPQITRYDKVDIYDYSGFMATPTLSFEYFITEVISIILMGDYVVGKDIGEKSSFEAPRVYIGILFNR